MARSIKRTGARRVLMLEERSGDEQCSTVVGPERVCLLELRSAGRHIAGIDELASAG
jgi:hypothetical protein